MQLLYGESPSGDLKAVFTSFREAQDAYRAGWIFATVIMEALSEKQGTFSDKDPQ